MRTHLDDWVDDLSFNSFNEVMISNCGQLSSGLCGVITNGRLIVSLDLRLP
jgi:hypothetical protein